MSEMAAVVGWYGPYKGLDDARAAARDWFDDYLYVAFGYKSSHNVGRPRFLYVGVGSQGSIRLNRSHQKIGERADVTISSIWLGSVDSHKVAGRREKKVEPLIDRIEWAMVSLFAPVQNERKSTFPAESFAIINRWWSGEDLETPSRKPLVIWPDVMECAGPHAPAYLCWLDQLKVRRIAKPRSGHSRPDREQPN